MAGSNNKFQELPFVIDSTGKPVGVRGLDGKEYLFGYITPPDTPFPDSSGTPGAATINSARGRCAIAAAASSVVITNSYVTASSVVLAVIDQAAADATLLEVVRVTPAAGSFTIYGNAAATATTTVRFVVLN